MKSSPPRRLAASRATPSRSTVLTLLLALGVGGAIYHGTSVRRSLDGRPVVSAIPAVRAVRILDSAAPPIDVFAPAAPLASATMADAIMLAEAGRFAEAAELVGKLTPELRQAALVSIFALWAKKDPRLAATAALSLEDDARRNLAWHAVAVAWAESDPAALAAHALSLSDDTARNQAFDAALPRWLERDARSAMEWVGALVAGSESDSAVAILARHPALLERGPELALDWAEAIQDSALRSRTLGVVVRAWLSASPAEAARYARQSPDILPSEKEDILVGERFTLHP